MLAQPVILATLHLKLIFDVTNSAICHLELGFQVKDVLVALFKHPLYAIDFRFSGVDFGLFLLQHDLGLIVNFFLFCGDSVQLLAHVLNLLCLRVVDVRLP